jgi:hypothetical protein
MSNRRTTVLSVTSGSPDIPCEIRDKGEFAEAVYRSEAAKDQYKAECKKAGRRYRRQDWIDKVAELFGLDVDTFTNRVNRSSQRRRKKLRAKLSASVPSKMALK